MGRDPPYFTPLLPLVPGRSRPYYGGPRAGGSRGRAEGEGGGRWRRRPRKVRSGGARGYAREAFQERVRQGGDDLKGPR